MSKEATFADAPPGEVPSAPQQRFAGRFLRALGKAALLLVAVYVALRGVGLGGQPAGVEIDPSWRSVLGWAWANSGQFGSEIVFTYGPLGFLHPEAAYVAQAFSDFLCGQLVLGCIYFVSTGVLLTRLQRGLRVFYAIGLLACTPLLLPDTLWLLVLAQNAVLLGLPALGAKPLAEPLPGYGGLVETSFSLILGAAAAALSLIKFTLVPAAAVTVLAASVALAAGGRRAVAVAHALGFVMGFVGIWVGSGQHLINITASFLGFHELAVGYGATMGLMPPWQIDVLGFLSLAATGGWLGIQALRHIGRPGRAALLFALGCVAFVSWRGGFTRADGHVFITLPFLVLVPMLGIALTEKPGPYSLGSGIAASGLALVVGYALAHLYLGSGIGPWRLDQVRWAWRVDQVMEVVRGAADPGQLRQRREAAAERLRNEHPMTEIRRVIGRDTVDVMNWGQGLAILHGLNYRPRPVFQSYSAYTPSLLRLNAMHFEAADAPRFVLINLQAIDGRLPSAEDAHALLAILRGYTPVLEEDGFLLFRRAVDGALPEHSGPEPTREVPFDRWIEVPAGDGMRMLSVAATPSSWGRLYSFWFRTVPLLLQVETSEGRSTFRLQPEASRSGFLLSPLILNNRQLAQLYTGHPGGQVRRIRVTTSSPWLDLMWDAEVRLGFAELEWQLPDPDSAAAIPLDTVLAGFNLRDQARSGRIEPMEEQGEPVLFMHSPAHLDFELPPGRYRLNGEFGLLESALSSPGCQAAKPDGIQLSIYIRNASGPWSLVSHRTINPWLNDEDRSPRSIEATLSLTAAGCVRVAVEAGPSGSSHDCDWAWLRQLQILPIDAHDSRGD